MKGSGVYQSLKSLASKLHPQLPLSSRESQRLLTALTSSFRQQLDRVHPQRPGGNETKTPQETASLAERPGKGSLHASLIDAADQHLASVLTSPLLTRSYGSRAFKLDYESAQKSLLEDPHQDPVSLLEDYHANGVATIPVAALCLEHFRQRLNKMDKEQRVKLIDSTKAGIRTLHWLWNSKLHDTDGFVDDQRLMDVMVPFVIDEGREDVLWEWLALRISLGSQTETFRGKKKQNWYKYRWKGRVLKAMVAHKMYYPPKPKCADDALKVVLRAYELEDCPIVQPMLQIISMLRQHTGRGEERWSATNNAVFQKFVDLAVERTGASDVLKLQHRAELLLHHPTKPDGQPYYELFQTLFDPGAREDIGCSVLLDRIETPRDEQQRGSWIHELARTAAWLEGQQKLSEAEWVITQINRLYPNGEQRIARALQIHRNDFSRKISDKHTDGPVHEPALEPAPFPAFI